MIQEEKRQFEKNGTTVYEKAVLRFDGVDGYAVYNCSAPFIADGKRCLFGRVEKPDVWSDSRVILFEEIEPDHFAAVEHSRLYPLEDPFVCYHQNEWLLGGVHVVKKMGDIDFYSCYFYRSDRPDTPVYYTAGPRGMKDIRMVSLGDQLGVFTRPGNYVGFTVVDGIESLTADAIACAPLTDLIEEGGHGSVNQALLLDSGLLAIIGHDSYSYPAEADWYSQHHVYFVTAAVFDPESRRVLHRQILATRSSFVPDTPQKVLPTGIPMADVTFPSGILPRPDGRIDLYAGVCDCGEQRIVLDNPFAPYGRFVI